MIARDSAKSLKNIAEEFRVLVLTGPRQSGKTTLIKNEFPKYEYFNLENPDMFSLINSDPGGFMAIHDSKVIFDEVQRMPALLSYIQSIVDEKRTRGNFLLSGSQNILLSEKIGQSLAGRAAYHTLFPLSISELKSSELLRKNVWAQIFYGFYPEIYHEKINPINYYNQYISTYIERDLRQIKSVANLVGFKKFISLLAGRIGQLLDNSSLANDVGVSSATIENWLSILEASYLIIRLKPFHGNFGKRYIKSPKVYFTDTGLACRLLNIKSPEEAEFHYLRGGLFENLCVMDIYKTILNKQINADLYFFRTSDGKEVDLIIDGGNSQISMEIKSAGTYNNSFKTGIEHWNKLTGNKAAKSIIAYSGKTAEVSGIKLMNWQDLSGALAGF
jgi:predicted AAA+ superfamily ATPase